MHGPVERWFRQTPAHDGRFGATQFSGDPCGHAEEWLIVCDDPPRGFRTRVPRKRRVLFLGEPPAIKSYATAYLNQYGTVIGPAVIRGYDGRHIVQHSALPWHYGRARPISWDGLAMDKEKRAEISVFCSSKAVTRQQVRRIAFVAELKRHFGAIVDHFGKGEHELPEKADGLDPYRYTVVLENNLEDDFWTEKLADAYLGHCFPIYSGGRISPRDFDPAARLDIDICDPANAFRSIEALLESRAFERCEPLIREQRKRVMSEHNFFAVADRLIRLTNVSPGRRLAWPRHLRRNKKFE